MPGTDAATLIKMNEIRNDVKKRTVLGHPMQPYKGYAYMAS
jgi:hypothetical protein